jgi:hypothetical protein
MLPDDVLLEIFSFCVDQGQDTNEEMKSWRSLVHVCRWWRIIVFGSSCRLNLRLFCTPRTSGSATLDIWPALPLLIKGSIFNASDAINTITMLNCNDRIHQIELKISASQFDYVSAAMQKPFLEVTRLQLAKIYHVYNTNLILPDSFLGGSVPRLRELWLKNVSFLGLPNLLLSAAQLVTLRLDKPPRHGIFSPEAMAAALSVLTRLEALWLKFKFSLSRSFDAEGHHLPPPTRSVLPALVRFTFQGRIKDLEILVAQLDTPLLSRLSVTFLDDIDVDTPQLARFISHAPRFRANDQAKLVFVDDFGAVRLESRSYGHGGPTVLILSNVSVPSLLHICTPTYPPLSTLERLYIYEIENLGPEWREDVEDIQWLESLRSFTAVKNLYISEEAALLILPHLRELALGRTREVLPTLQNIFVEGLQRSGPDQEGVGEFVAALHPLNVSPWNRPTDLEDDAEDDDSEDDDPEDYDPEDDDPEDDDPEDDDSEDDVPEEDD